MNKNVGIVLGVVLLLAIAVLTTIGLRMAPMEQAANSAESRQTCEVEAPEALRASARDWCANGLLALIKVTEERENLVVIVRFNPNGAHIWQLQNSNLLGSFKSLTDRMAAAANGRNIAVSIHDASDNRLAACARLSTDAAATCTSK
jgi:hypothetical protein